MANTKAECMHVITVDCIYVVLRPVMTKHISHTHISIMCDYFVYHNDPLSVTISCFWSPMLYLAATGCMMLS